VFENPRKIILRSSLVATAIAALAVSGCKRRAALGAGCSADGDCAEALLCHGGECLQEQSVKQMRAGALRSASPDGDGNDDEARPARNVGDHVDVEWKGAYRPATIIGVVAPGSYRVHYDGHDAEWDEVITESRIKGGARKPRQRGSVSPR
jgi:hypothetical protein